jgi:hypothetical protein
MGGVGDGGDGDGGGGGGDCGGGLGDQGLKGSCMGRAEAGHGGAEGRAGCLG